MIPIFNTFSLRQWRRDDCAGIAACANNPRISANLRDGFPYPYTLEDADRFVEMALSRDPQTFFAIADNDEAIGSIGMAMGTDVHRYTAEMGYWLAESYWGQGIMSRTVIAFTDWAFAQFDLIRIASTPYASNPASARVLEKAGFKFEGCLRASVIKNGQVLDQLMYAKVSEENAMRIASVVTSRSRRR